MDSFHGTRGADSTSGRGVKGWREGTSIEGKGGRRRRFKRGEVSDGL